MLFLFNVDLKNFAFSIHSLFIHDQVVDRGIISRGDKGVMTPQLSDPINITPPPSPPQ